MTDRQTKGSCLPPQRQQPCWSSLWRYHTPSGYPGQRLLGLAPQSGPGYEHTDRWRRSVPGSDLLTTLSRKRYQTVHFQKDQLMKISTELKNVPLKFYYSKRHHSLPVHTESTYKHNKLTKQQKHVSIIPMSSGRLRSFTLMALSYNKHKRKKIKQFNTCWHTLMI